MRRSYDNDGNACNDCLTSWCCPCCALVQVDKEVKEKEGLAGNKQGYTSIYIVRLGNIGPRPFDIADHVARDGACGAS